MYPGSGTRVLDWLDKRNAVQFLGIRSDFSFSDGGSPPGAWRSPAFTHHRRLPCVLLRAFRTPERLASCSCNYDLPRRYQHRRMDNDPDALRGSV